MRRSVMYAAIAAILVAGMARALNCGDTITQSTVLNANIGPCPAGGLIIAGQNITLELNGYKISGQGNGTGVSLAVVAYDVVISGSGKIVNFFVGIEGHQASNVTIHDVTLRGNSVGIDLTQSSGHHIFATDVRNGVTGMHISETEGVTIEDNEITGQSEEGILINLGAVTISQNRIKLNGSGITGGHEMNPVIRGNFILNNDQDGIRLAGGSCVVIEDNYVNRNGGSGILVTDRDKCVIRNNTANANDVYGIGVSGGAQVTGNRALRNGTDLF